MDNTGSQLELDYKSTWNLFQGKTDESSNGIDMAK